MAFQKYPSATSTAKPKVHGQAYNGCCKPNCSDKLILKAGSMLLVSLPANDLYECFRVSVFKMDKIFNCYYCHHRYPHNGTHLSVVFSPMFLSASLWGSLMRKCTAGKVPLLFYCLFFLTFEWIVCTHKWTRFSTATTVNHRYPHNGTDLSVVFGKCFLLG